MKRNGNNVQETSLYDMTKITLPTPILLETDGPLPAKTQQTTLKNPFKQALLLAVECVPLAYCV